MQDKFETEVETVSLPEEQKSPKKRKWVKRLTVGIAIFLGVVVLILGIGTATIFHYINKMNLVTEPSYSEIIEGPDEEVDPNIENSPQQEINNAEDNVNNNSENEQEIMYSDKVINVLLIGTDGRTASERGRSDSMILISVNKVTGKFYMTSFLRDAYVDIPGVANNNRLNAAYSFGGANLLLETIELNYKIRIDKYVQVDFESFTEIIDYLGGIELTVTNGEAGEIYGISTGGTYKLTGAQALQYARIRHVGNGDFGRAQRQRRVLSIILDQCKALSISELTSLLDALLPNLTTNMSSTEIFRHVLASPTYFSYPLTQQQVPKTDTIKHVTIRHMAVFSVNFEENIQYIKDTIYEGIY